LREYTADAAQTIWDDIGVLSGAGHSVRDPPSLPHRIDVSSSSSNAAAVVGRTTRVTVVMIIDRRYCRFRVGLTCSAIDRSQILERDLLAIFTSATTFIMSS
jgi:hypothetical protein